MKKILLIGGIMLALTLIVLNFLPENEVAQGAITFSGPTNLIGTRTGTTTTGAVFSTWTRNGTTSATTNITSMADIAVFTLKATAASSTEQGGGIVAMNIYGSYDSYCDTTATSTTDAAYLRYKPLVNDINWFDAGTHIAELAGSATIPTATSTISWVTSQGKGRDLTLVNLNYECLKVELNATSTNILLQVKTKGSN